MFPQKTVDTYLESVSKHDIFRKGYSLIPQKEAHLIYGLSTTICYMEDKTFACLVFLPVIGTNLEFQTDTVLSSFVFLSQATTTALMSLEMQSQCSKYKSSSIYCPFRACRTLRGVQDVYCHSSLSEVTSTFYLVTEVELPNIHLEVVCEHSCCQQNEDFVTCQSCSKKVTHLSVTTQVTRLDIPLYCSLLSDVIVIDQEGTKTYHNMTQIEEDSPRPPRASPVVKNGRISSAENGTIIIPKADVHLILKMQMLFPDKKPMDTFNGGVLDDGALILIGVITIAVFIYLLICFCKSKK